MKISKKIKCRISGGKLIDILNLGDLPLSSFPDKKDPTPKRLPVTVCLNPNSGLVQLRHTVDPDEMYSQYWYMSGVNDSMKLALKSIVLSALDRCKATLGEKPLVVDIASNDGTLLSAYPSHFFRVGIDPAKNIKPKQCDLHINTYFSKEAYQKHLGEKKADIVTSISMFYDLENPVQFAKDVHNILKDNGLWILEHSYLPTMLERNSFDTICSEHLEYYSLQAMDYIFDQSGFEVEDVELNDVNGGSFRLYVRKKGQASVTDNVIKMREKEKSLKLNEPATYQQFEKRIQENKKEIINFLKTQKRLNKLVLGYGASTKGNTILSYLEIGPELIPFIADRNPIKHGRLTVTGIPIISEEEARKMNPDYFFTLPYHFMDEFLTREKSFLSKGGKFVVPVPRLSLIPDHGRAL
ncbi:MAG TPA: hypothetical protein DCE71_06820 [Parachlamydiales bacterium]|nr:hypothetical protein [Parachlamydiales bacterium]